MHEYFPTSSPSQTVIERLRDMTIRSIPRVAVKWWMAAACLHMASVAGAEPPATPAPKDAPLTWTKPSYPGATLSAPGANPTKAAAAAPIAPSNVTVDPAASQLLPAGILAWDEEMKETAVLFGTPSLVLAFHVTNVSQAPVVITSISASPGCTVSKSATMPWTLAPGGKGAIDVTLNLTGMHGTVMKNLTVLTEQGVKTLGLRTTIHEPPPSVRARVTPGAPETAGGITPANSPAPPPMGPPLPDGLLAWDAETREATVKFGTKEVPFAFRVSNISKESIVVTSVRTSCGCTAAKLPEMPWMIAPGAKGTIDAVMNLTGKRGIIQKNVMVITDHGFKTLNVRTNIEEPPAGAMGENDRIRNLQIASANRQAVLHGECASCHSTPALGKLGAELYQAACTICHEGERRASSVPDLRHLQKATNAEYWRTWITTSAEGKLMPAFSTEHGGILSTAQIDSLVRYLMEAIPSGKPPEPSAQPALRAR